MMASSPACNHFQPFLEQVMACGRKANPTQIRAGRASSSNASHTSPFKERVIAGVKHVQFRPPRHQQFLPWVTVRNSELGGKGVFAARKFFPTEKIGKYTGRVLGRPNDPATQAAIASSHSTMLITVSGIIVDGSRPPQSEDAQKALIGRVLYKSGTEWPGAYAHVVNSAYDMQAKKMVPGRQNCRITYGGVLVATKVINVGDELLQNYGPEYHKQMK